jgi:hypothetical protein
MKNKQNESNSICQIILGNSVYLCITNYNLKNKRIKALKKIDFHFFESIYKMSLLTKINRFIIKDTVKVTVFMYRLYRNCSQELI